MSSFKKSKLTGVKDLLQNQEEENIKKGEQLSKLEESLIPPDKSKITALNIAPGDRPPVVEFKNVTKKYVSDGGKEVVAIKDINFKVDDLPIVSEMIVILGASGCGKSTILKIIAGLVPPGEYEGEALSFDQRVGLPDSTRAMVFQDYSSLPWRTVLDNVALGLELKGVKKKERYELSRKYIKWVGLEGKEESYPSELSGGQKQRVAIARTLLVNSRIILMDEPFGALDISTRYEMQELLCKLYSEVENTIILVTHDISEAVYLSDRIFLMTPSPGQIVEEIAVPLKRDEQGRRDRESSEYMEMEKLLRKKMISIIEGRYEKN